MLDRVMCDIAADPWVLCEVVGRGPFQWRRAFLDAMHAAGFPLTDETVANELFSFFCVRVQQLAGSDAPAQTLAGHFLDQLDVDQPHVPTEHEIAESWELESASTPDGQAFAYGGKTKDEVMRGLAGELDPTFEHDDDVRPN
jgi:hypothetical protein